MNKLICPHCSVALMYEHETLNNWMKCELCGYCEFKESKGRYKMTKLLYISMDDYLGKDRKLTELSPELISNANTIVPKVNELLTSFGEHRRVTSGYRSLEDHQRIYKQINDKRHLAGLLPLKIPMSSKHLRAAACDLEDEDGKLVDWAKNNLVILESIGFWCEEGTVGWLHVQIFPPLSGKRFFNP